MWGKSGRRYSSQQSVVNSNITYQVLITDEWTGVNSPHAPHEGNSFYNVIQQKNCADCYFLTRGFSL